MDLLLLAVVLIGCQYTYAGGYTLYEDDFAFATGAFLVKNIWGYIGACFTSWPQGRPLGMAFPATISWLLDSRVLLYAYSASIVFLNAALIYKIINARLSRVSGLVAALVFITFPGDTTKILLTHTLQIQPGILTCLTAIIFYDKNKTASYGIAALSLLFYESTFLPYLCAPLLSTQKYDAKKIVAHLFYVFLLVAIYATVRIGFEESRVGDALAMSPLALAGKIIKNLCIGSLAGIYSYVVALKAVLSADSVTASITALFAALFVYLYIRKGIVFKEKETMTVFLLLLLIPASYLLSFTHGVWVFSGRMTSVHIANSVVFSFAAGFIFNAYGKYLIVFVVFCFAIGVAFSNYTLISMSYSDMAGLQKSIYLNVLSGIEDAESGDCVAIDTFSGDMAKDKKYKSRFIDPMSWGDTYAFFAMQGAESKIKMTAPLYSNRVIRYENNHIEMQNYGYPDYDNWISYLPENVIYFVAMGGFAERREMTPPTLGFAPVPVKGKHSRQGSFALNEKFIRFAFGDAFWADLMEQRRNRRHTEREH